MAILVSLKVYIFAVNTYVIVAVFFFSLFWGKYDYSSIKIVLDKFFKIKKFLEDWKFSAKQPKENFSCENGLRMLNNMFDKEKLIKEIILKNALTNN